MNYVKPYRIPNGVFVLLLALAAFPVAAQDSGMAYVPNANKPGGNWVKFTDGVSYKKVLSPAAYGGAITGTIDALSTNPSGNQVALKYTAGASGAAVGAAVGKFASKVVAPLAVGVALYDLGKELGYIFDNSTGELVVQTEQKMYRWSSNYAGWNGGNIWPDTEAACTAAQGGNTPYKIRLGVGSWGCYTNKRADGSYFGGILVWATAVVSTNLTPSTVTNFQNDVTAKTSWPDTSAITRTLQQAQQDYDIFLDYNPVTVSGPASTPGKTSTTTSSTGTTTTSTTTHNHSYEGANVTTSNVTVTNVTNNAGDTTTTTTTETPVKEEPTPDQCEKNPDSIGCSEFGTPEAQELPQKSIAVQLTPVVFASSATCPADAIANLDFTRFNRHLLRSKLNWRVSHEESQIPSRI